MSETVISVADAAKDFLRILSDVEREGHSATLLREGKPVAILTPITKPAATCAELAERWAKLPRLSPEESASFAEDIETARGKLVLTEPAWD
jgi:antitoxin (DNA-binding transcriptional repressor) of toxin-antitoxin stability system